jgi:hypothetical protein
LSLSRRLLIPGLLCGSLLRALALPTPGTGDVTIWKVWSFAASHDVTGVYGVGGSPPERRVLRWHGQGMTVDYPPASLEELALVGRLYRSIDPRFEDSRTLNALVKLPGLLAEILIVGLVLAWGRRHGAGDAAAWIALAWWLNPAVIIDGPLLGYLDAEMAVPAMLALACALAGPAWIAGALLALAVLTKAQAIFAAPVIMAALMGGARPLLTGGARPLLTGGARGQPWRRFLHGAIGGTLMSAALLLPYLARGAWANVVQAVGRLATRDALSANGANLWWVATWILRAWDVHGEWGWGRALTQEVRILSITRAMEIGVPNPRVLGISIVGLLCAWAMREAWRSQSSARVAALAGWSAYAYALFAAQVHENHLYLAMPFFVVAGGLDRRYRPLCWAVSAIVSLNLLLFYGLGQDAPEILHRDWTGLDGSVLLAVASLVTFAWGTGIVHADPPST